MQSKVGAGYPNGTRPVACSVASRVSLSAFPGAAMTTFSPGANGFSSFCMPDLVCIPSLFSILHRILSHYQNAVGSDQPGTASTSFYTPKSLEC